MGFASHQGGRDSSSKKNKYMPQKISIFLTYVNELQERQKLPFSMSFRRFAAAARAAVARASSNRIFSYNQTLCHHLHVFEFCNFSHLHCLRLA